MVGLVVVCHSRALARAAVALAAQMVRDEPVPIEVAAGLDETVFGTDAAAITSAVTAADRGDGVVVLMDLGSAVLSADLALELLDEAVRDRVVLSPAPLVEGLVAAAVAAAGGAGRAEVAAEAAGALAGKQSQLGIPGAGGSPPGGGSPPAGGSSRAGQADPGGGSSPAGAAPPAGAADPDTAAAGGPSAVVTVTNPHGLHARPAARLVAHVRAFDARVEVRNRSTGSPWVPASSLSRVATLGALRGHEIEVRASGPQAGAAVDGVVALAARAFEEPPTSGPDPAVRAGEADPAVRAGETDPAVREGKAHPAVRAGDARPVAVPAVAATPRRGGTPASPGIAIGPARQARAPVLAVRDVPSRGPATEWRRIGEALDSVRRDLRRLRAETARAAGESPAAIFDAHLLLLDDADLLADARSRIDGGSAAPQAWQAATSRVVADFEALPDPYLRDRAADVRAIAGQVLQALLGVSAAAPGPGVLIAADLTPAEAATLDPGRVAGVLVAGGSPTSHGAILARGRGIPAVVALGPAVLDVADGTPVALDGGTGEVVVAPPDPVLASFRERAARQAVRRREAVARAAAPAVTRDGVRIAVGANLGSPADARVAVAGGADLAGLVRTEFLFLNRDEAPDVDEQEAAYREIAAALGGRRVTLRTLDVGGDKPLPYLAATVERNPFLGVRGIRHSLAHPALFAGQLLAIARVARDVPVSVMFPMVSTVSEVLWARRMLDEAVARAGGEAPGLRAGIMLEVPAAALKAAAFAPCVDFVSIGTNDLIQYALAAERGNAAVVDLADGLDPGVLRLVDAVCRGVGERVAVAVCGELAGDEAAVPLLAGLGVRQLSVAPVSVPAVKATVRTVGLERAATVAARALQLPDAAAVRAMLAESSGS